MKESEVVQNVQKLTLSFYTFDENNKWVFTEKVFCANIQSIPETLPIPIPITVPTVEKEKALEAASGN